MFFSLMPLELNYHIVSFIEPEKVTNTQIKICATQLANISLVNKEFHKICSKKLAVLKKINDLVKKYCQYNRDYENSSKDWKTGIEFDLKGNPQLLDALFTGCKFPFAESTFKVYNQEIEQDIKDIVKLTPLSKNCTLGRLKLRYGVPPLAVACINVNIPLHIVEFLLQQGANPNATYNVNKHSFTILEDLEDRIDAKRFAAVKKLFSKYGAV